MVVIGGLILCPIIAYVLWQIYKVCSRVKGFKPMAKLFSEQKEEIFNISDIVSNRLHTLEGWLSSLMSTINAVTGTELALPSSSDKPTPSPRRDSIPMLELNVTQQTIQETVKDTDRQGSKIRRYKKYLQKQSTEGQKYFYKRTLKEVTQIKGLQHIKCLKNHFVNCTYLCICIQHKIVC